MTGNPPRRRINRRTLKRIARWLVALAFIAVLVHQVDWRDVSRHLLHADRTGLVLGLLVLGLSRLVKAARSYPLMRVQTTELPFWVCLRTYLASGSAAYVLPTGFGGDLLRAVALGRRRNLVPEVTASIAMERVLSGVAMVMANLLAALYALRGREPGRFALASVALAAIGVAALLVPLNQRVRDWIRRRLARFAGSRWAQALGRFGNAYHAYWHRPGVLVLVFLLSLAETLLVVFSMAFLAEATGTGITVGMLLVVVPLTLVLHRLPITYWGIGVVEGGFAFLLHALYLIPPSHALTVAAAYRLAELCANIPGALLWRDLAGSRERESTEAGGQPRVPLSVRT